jgi:D-alanine-D-alanine ligase
MTRLPGPVGVIAGGLSHERDVSLASGRVLAGELRDQGLDVQLLDFDTALVDRLRSGELAVAFPALHGRGGEDGEIQSLLELLGMPFVGSSSSSCRLTWDKTVARTVLERAGVPVPSALSFSAQTFRDVGPGHLMPIVLERLGTDLVVKPTESGSALGISAVHDAPSLSEALVTCFAYGDAALIEEFVHGIDVSVAVVAPHGEPRALEPVSVAFDAGHEMDYAGRYSPELMSVQSPAGLAAGTLDALKEVALTAHRELGLRDLSRSDFKVRDDGSFVLLETAITPGLTETSLFRIACTTSGHPLGEVARDLVATAASRQGREG